MNFNHDHDTHDHARREAMKTDQSDGRGFDFSGNDVYPPVPWLHMAIYGALAFIGLFGMCAIAAVGAV